MILSSPFFWKAVKNQHWALQTDTNEGMRNISFTTPSSPFQSHNYRSKNHLWLVTSSLSIWTASSIFSQRKGADLCNNGQMTESHSNVLGSNTVVLWLGTWREIWKIWHHLLAQATGSRGLVGWPLNRSHSCVSPYLQTDCCHYLSSFVLPFYRGFFLLFFFYDVRGTDDKDDLSLYLLTEYFQIEAFF